MQGGLQPQLGETLGLQFVSLGSWYPTLCLARCVPKGTQNSLGPPEGGVSSPRSAAEAVLLGVKFGKR